MKKFSIYLLLIFFCLFSSQNFAQNPVSDTHKIDLPLRIPLYLSGNFGELRSNHFHSGLDFKTQGVVGKSVYSIEDGYVSRISVSPSGYGRALYITHPSLGITTVCGHLSRFNTYIDSVVKARQYENESFSVNLTFGPDEIPVKRGQLVAKSGNTGSSGGPHVHFEIRETETEAPMDPLPYFRRMLKDTRKPQIRGVYLTAIPGRGYSNGEAGVTLVKKENAPVTLSKPLTAWGEVYLGVKAYDYMNETTNIYGVYSIQLQVDSQLVFSSVLDKIPFEDTRYLNSFIDYKEWKTKRSFVMKSKVDPGNKLDVYKQVVNRGIITIDQERPYRCVYTLRDAFGNKTVLEFTIQGKKHTFKSEEPCDTLLAYNRPYTGMYEGARIDIPEDAFYEDVPFTYRSEERSGYLSALHVVHTPEVPVHKSYTLRVKIDADTIADKQKYYMASIQPGGGEGALVGKYDDGWYEISTNTFGTFAVKADTVAPTIRPLSPENWVRNGSVKFRIGDSQSGIARFRGTIDGAYALFEYDAKSATLSYKIDRQRVAKGKEHELVMTVTDNCGNQQQYTRKFSLTTPQSTQKKSTAAKPQPKKSVTTSSKTSAKQVKK